MIKIRNDLDEITFSLLKERKDLKKQITSLEVFTGILERDQKNAYDFLLKVEGIAPNAAIIREVHRALFENIFESAGQFREREKAMRKTADSAFAFTAVKNIETDLNHNSESISGFLEHNPSRKEKLGALARFHAGIMAIHPFEDLKDSFALNRILALTITEAQFRHCFRSPMRTELNAKDYCSALERCINDADIVPLYKVMKDLMHLRLASKDLSKTPEKDHEL